MDTKSYYWTQPQTNGGFYVSSSEVGELLVLDVQIGRLLQAFEGVGEDDGLVLAAQAVGSH
jgi:hypothetical protein